MSSLSISLPEALRQFVEEQVKSGGFGSPGEYVRSLIRGAQQREEEQERLEALLLEGLDSGDPVEVTPAFWEELRTELLERHQTVKRA